jgi:L-asparaginase II
MPTRFVVGLTWSVAVAAVLLNGTAVRAQERSIPLSEVLVEVTRGEIVESRHYGRIAIVAPDGTLLQAAGDPYELIFPRSALKPKQALATVALAQQQGIELPREEIAIMCASHEGHDYHVRTVQMLLQRAGADEERLYCGPVRGSRLCHNCSGKHSGMLLQAKLSGSSPDGYWRADHPVQQKIQQAIREFTGYDQPLQWGSDGCGVPNYALPLYHVALGYARLANPESAPEQYRAAAYAIREAMQAHPDLISSRESFDADLMAAGAGRLLGKTGAEACYGLGLSQPAVGIAVKIEDGNPRGMPCVLLETLERLEALTPEIEAAVGASRTVDLTNSVGTSIGQIRAAPWRLWTPAEGETKEKMP